ncbi:DoxX family protein [Spongiactinospora sp. TRM90649]|uniref:DoxX family protein n=1 Tax=Spongiactinospora sp. TRM90649 TaxID=3031114 RepID=UPI0023F8E25D|nr:DoxX family protein [Spongiactinospora sp. TRM90649]MDF5759159.1 DoxX family protein [Spongiactinospora sp. TRM90649]
MIDRARPIALLLARVAIGAVFFVHGWMKLTQMGLGMTTQFFEGSGVPLAMIAAPAITFLEIIGGVAFILGAALPVFGVLLALDMVGAMFFVHFANGFTVDKGGYEFVLALGAGALAVAFSRGGAFALDDLWHRRRQSATTNA